MPRYVTTVSIEPEFYEICKANKISWSEAARVGAGILLAEKGIKEYDSNLNIMRRMEVMRLKLEETSQQLEEIKKNAA